MSQPVFDIIVTSPAHGLPSWDPKCLQVQIYLALASVQYRRHTSAYPYSPSKSELPNVIMETYSHGGLDSLLFVHKHVGLDRTNGLINSERADSQSYTMLINDQLQQAMLYLQWCVDDNYNEVTASMVKGDMSFPLRVFVPWYTKTQIKSKLTLLGLDTEQKAIDQLEQAFRILSNKLGTTYPFLCGSRPSMADAALAAHIAAIYNIQLPSYDARVVLDTRFPNLMVHCKHILSMTLPEYYVPVKMVFDANKKQKEQQKKAVEEQRKKEQEEEKKKDAAEDDNNTSHDMPYYQSSTYQNVVTTAVVKSEEDLERERHNRLFMGFAAVSIVGYMVASKLQNRHDL